MIDSTRRTAEYRYSMVERILDWTRRHPRLFDVFVAVFWGLLSLGNEELWAEDSRLWIGLVGIGLVAGALIWRRTHPLIAFAVPAVSVLVLTLIVDVNFPLPLAFLASSYSVAAHATDRRQGMMLFASTLTVGVVGVLITEFDIIGDAAVTVLLLVLAWIGGDSLRTRRAYQQSVLDRAERAEALRDSLALQAVAEERTRIARELHDVVAHSMSLMVVQAGAGRRVVDSDPAAAQKALESIETVGRNSLGEMRRILGVLRGDEQGTQRLPQPDIAAIDSLADEFRSAGLPVSVEHQGDRRSLPPTVELTAYRIVQESLTNTLKHAGRAEADVTLDYGADELRILIEDNGRLTPPALGLSAASGAQKGLVGMRERIAAFGGDFDAGRRSSGGYRVHASLPLQDQAPA